MSTKKVFRCAIYTRKSHEEGLEQEFNSLHAQREACEAYIKSQKHEGWQVVKTDYDDGGFTGGNMERPALKQLLADITAGKVDVIVVYKVDRLSRSLHDFARMVEVFDKHGVSFVSVTQQFNTTTSMGRLTLNVLLSFAQFEREVTGERIRDKIAASKKKGMWMGGFVPLGYDVVDRKLVINAGEAEIIRHIYQRYMELSCVRLLKEEMDNSGIRSKERINKENGTKSKGSSFSRGNLYKILSNPIYIGQIRHKDACHPGQHAAIIDHALWEQVQQKLKSRTLVKPGRPRKTDSSLLLGKLFDESGQGLTPSHAVKQGRRYRYYISRHLTTGPGRRNKAGWRLPAQETEQAVMQAARGILSDRPAITDTLMDCGVAAHEIPAVLSAAAEAGSKHDNTDIIRMVERVELRQEGIRLKLSLELLLPAGINTLNPVSLIKDVPMQMKRRGAEMRLVIQNGNASAKCDKTLIKVVARASAWFDDLLSGRARNLAEIASKENVTDRYIAHRLPLAFLAPDIMEDIITGHQPADLTTEDLLRRIDIPLEWAEQRRTLGFN